MTPPPQCLCLTSRSGGAGPPSDGARSAGPERHSPVHLRTVASGNVLLDGAGRSRRPPPLPSGRDAGCQCAAADRLPIGQRQLSAPPDAYRGESYQRRLRTVPLRLREPIRHRARHRGAERWEAQDTVELRGEERRTRWSWEVRSAGNGGAERWEAQDTVELRGEERRTRWSWEVRSAGHGGAERWEPQDMAELRGKKRRTWRSWEVRSAGHGGVERWEAQDTVGLRGEKRRTQRSWEVRSAGHGGAERWEQHTGI